MQANSLDLPTSDKSIFMGKLNKMLKSKPGDLDFISDDEILEVVVVLPHDNIEVDLEPLMMEVSFKNGEEIIILNGKRVDRKELEKRQNKVTEKFAKAKEKRIEKTRKRIEAFSKKNGLENSSAIVKAYENGSSLITLKIKKGELQEFALKNKNLIIAIELASKTMPTLSGAMIDTNIDNEALGNTNTRGNGIGIYMYEAIGCPDENHITNYTRLDGSTDEHSEIVSAILRGVSPETYIYCRTDGDTLPSDSELNGIGGHLPIYIENYSFEYTETRNNIYTTYDFAFDTHIYEDNIAVFVAAGNRGNDEEYVSSPAKSINSITVGNYDDGSSPREMRSASSFKNSIIGNEKPEISAPGTSLNIAGYTNKSGTSLSAPHASGFAADLMSVMSSLKLKPHLVKAFMLASATNEISGGDYIEGDNKDGVGGIDFNRAMNNPQYISYEGVNSIFSYYAALDSKPANEQIDWEVDLIGGKETRIAISWLNSSNYLQLFIEKKINMNFDLEVYDTNNNLVASSSDSNDPFEVIDFTPISSGEYRVSIKRVDNRDTNNLLRLGAVVTIEE